MVNIYVSLSDRECLHRMHIVSVNALPAPHGRSARYIIFKQNKESKLYKCLG